MVKLNVKPSELLQYLEDVEENYCNSKQFYSESDDMYKFYQEMQDGVKELIKQTKLQVQLDIVYFNDCPEYMEDLSILEIFDFINQNNVEGFTIMHKFKEDDNVKNFSFFFKDENSKNMFVEIFKDKPEYLEDFLYYSRDGSLEENLPDVAFINVVRYFG